MASSSPKAPRPQATAPRPQAIAPGTPAAAAAASAVAGGAKAPRGGGAGSGSGNGSARGGGAGRATSAAVPIVARSASGNALDGSARGVGGRKASTGSRASVGSQGSSASSSGSSLGRTSSLSYGSWMNGLGGGGAGGALERRGSAGTSAAHTSVALRMTRPSTVPALRRWHALTEVNDYGPAKSIKACAVCKEAVVWPDTPTYLLCRRCLTPVHCACVTGAEPPGFCDADGHAGAVAFVDNVAVALADKVARLNVVEGLIAQSGNASGGAAAPVRDRRLSVVRDDDVPLTAERKAELVRERTALLSTTLMPASEMSPDAARFARSNDRNSFMAVAGGLKDRVLSALS